VCHVLYVVMLSVIMLGVVMLGIVAPLLVEQANGQIQIPQYSTILNE
jgi:hypothetical protein